jgi:hypothetical protein
MIFLAESPPQSSRVREGLRVLAFLGDLFPLSFQGFVTTEKAGGKLGRDKMLAESYGRAGHVPAGGA